MVILSRPVMSRLRMIKPQLPLQLQATESADFADFIGQQDVVNYLKNYADLPPFCYLWGAPCCGKSHLLSAYSLQRQQCGDQGVLFSAGLLKETDLTDMIQPQWSYVSFDDLHLIAGNQMGERHLFNLFNICRAERIPLLVAAQISPRHADWQLPDLRSRLQSGLTLELSVLKGEQAMQLLQRQFKKQGIPIDESVFRYIAAHYATDYASLHELLQKLSARSLRDKRKITVPYVKHVIAEK